MSALDPIGVDLRSIAATSGATTIAPISTQGDIASEAEALGFKPVGATAPTGPTVPSIAPADEAAKLGFRPVVAPTQSVRAAPADWLPSDPVSRFARAVPTFGLGDLAVAGVHTAGSAFDAWRAGRPYDWGSDMAVSLAQIQHDKERLAQDNPNLSSAAKGAGTLTMPGEAMLIERGVQAVGNVAKAGIDAVQSATRVAPIAAKTATAAPASEVPTLGQNIARGAVTSGTLGATQATAEAPESASAEERALRAATGGVAGAAAGAILTPVTQGLFDLTRSIAGRGGVTVAEEAGNVQGRIAAGKPVVGAVDEIGDALRNTIDARTKAAFAEGTDAYTRAGQLGATLRPGGATDFARQVVQRTQVLGLDHTNGLAGLPGAQEAMRLISGLALTPQTVALPIAKAVVGATPTSTPLNPTRTVIGGNSLLDTQTRLNAIKPTTAQDAEALRLIRQAYREVFDAIPATPGFIQGPQEAVGLVQMGNAAWSRGMRLSAPRDDPGKIVAAWVDSGKTGMAVADDIMVLAGAGTKRVSDAVQVAGMLKGELGANSAEFNAVQQGLFVRQLGFGKTEAPKPQAVRDALYRLTDGDARALGEAIWTPEQLRDIRLFWRAIPTQERTTSAGKVALRSLTVAGTLVGASLGMTGRIPGMTVADAVGLGVGAGGGLGTAEMIGHFLKDRIVGEAKNPFLLKPLFSQRVGRGIGETGSAEIGAYAARTPPGQVASDTGISNVIRLPQ